MQQHRQRKVHRKPKRSNANFRLGQSTISAITNLLRGFEGAEGPAIEYIRREYLSKLCDEKLTPAIDRRSAAIEKWMLQERKNADTNRRLRGMDRGYNILPRVTFYAFLKFAQRLIENILGPLTDELVVGSFSGGASTSRRRTESHPGLKYIGEVDTTREASQYLDVIHRVIPFFRQHTHFYSLNEVEGAVLFTVPKKTDIDRCACKEPDVNMFLQKGVGAHIRRQLRRFGINLNDQSINRRLARVGSLSGDLATLDLSSASDSVTISCVQALLPTEWFLYLNDIRSQSVVVDGVTVRTEMFSSMGNGFTFELESLIFYALMRTVSYFEGISGVISVYGDDLIIPSGMYDMAVSALSEFGFSVNEEKSFATGPFRESCGGHYHLGEDITPFYLKRPPTHLTDLIRVVNQLRRWALAEEARQYQYPFLWKLWKDLVELVPWDLRGGYDMALDTVAVSSDRPVRRLIRRTEHKKIPDSGSYALWHNSNWNRQHEAETAFVPAETQTWCFKRPAKPGTTGTRGYFYEEVITTP